MKYFNEKYIDKSYVLDFRLNGTTQDLVVFSVPPQSEDFKFPQRISETKTFGGIVYDDYGNDTVQISINGSTINNEIRLIYKTNNISEDKVTGDDEIKYVRDLIRKYGQKSNLKNKTVYLYVNGTDSMQTFWQVLIQNFTIKRSKERPLSYDYQLELLGIDDEVLTKATNGYVYSENNASSNIETVTDTSSESSQIDSSENTTASNLLTQTASVEKNVTKLEESLKWDQKVINYCEKIKSKLKNVENDYANINSKIKSYVDIPVSVLTEVKSTLDTTIRTPLRILSNYSLTLINEVRDLAEGIYNLVDYGYELIKDSNVITSLKLQYIDPIINDSNDYIDYLCSIWINLFESANSMQATVKQDTEENVVIPGDQNTDDSLMKVYGYKEYIVQDGDTWDSIAYKFYGAADYSVILASYNSDLGELVIGLKIYIPIFTKQESIVNDDIYNEPGVKDNFGKDIEIHSGILKTGGLNKIDFSLIGGQSNLDQAIESRLSSEIDNSIRKVAYGIKSTVGSNFIPSGYILASIKQTLLRDKRIKSVDTISYEGYGDKLNIQIVYTTINDYQNTYEGVL